MPAHRSITAGITVISFCRSPPAPTQPQVVLRAVAHSRVRSTPAEPGSSSGHLPPFTQRFPCSGILYFHPNSNHRTRFPFPGWPSGPLVVPQKRKGRGCAPPGNGGTPPPFGAVRLTPSPSCACASKVLIVSCLVFCIAKERLVIRRPRIPRARADLRASCISHCETVALGT